eukprot:1157996-Pelagomonas_calceolata.AAC.5
MQAALVLQGSQLQGAGAAVAQLLCPGFGTYPGFAHASAPDLDLQIAFSHALGLHIAFVHALICPGFAHALQGALPNCFKW